MFLWRKEELINITLFFGSSCICGCIAPEKVFCQPKSNGQRKDSGQRVHPLIMARSSFIALWIAPEAVEGTCDQRRVRSDCADAQSDLSLRWSHKSYCRFYHVLDHLSYFSTKTNIVDTHLKR